MMCTMLLLLLLFHMSNDSGSNHSDCHQESMEVMISALLLPLFTVPNNKGQRWRPGGSRLARLMFASLAILMISLSFARAAHSFSFAPPSLSAQNEDLTINNYENRNRINSNGQLESAIMNEIESQNSHSEAFRLSNNNDINKLEINTNMVVNNNTKNNEAATWSLLLSALFDKLDSYDVNWSNFILAIILVMLTLTTAVGNLFVIVAILLERNLRTIGNYLVLSLAIADLLVACLVMPLAGIYQILDRWTLGVLLCDIWTSTDVFCCTASILHLLAIALDRYWAVTRVDYIRCQRNERRILFMISLVWIAACIISLAPVFGWKDAQFEWRITNDQECLISQDIGYQIFATCTTFYAPLTLTLIFYWKIYQVARKRIRRKPGNRVKISLQHPSSSSSTSSPGAKSQQQLRTQQQQRSKQPTCQSIVVSQRTGELGNGAGGQVVVSSVEKQIAMGGKIDQYSLCSSCPCSCHMQQTQSQQHSTSLPPSSQSNGMNGQALVQNLPSSISIDKQVAKWSSKTNLKQLDDGHEGDQKQNENKIAQQTERGTTACAISGSGCDSESESEPQSQSESESESESEFGSGSGSNKPRNDDHYPTILPAKNNKDNLDRDSLKAGQSNEEGQTFVCSSLDGLSEAGKTTAVPNNKTQMIKVEEQRNLAGVNVDMTPGANIRITSSTQESCLINDRDTNEPIDINPSACTSISINSGSGSNNNNCSECPGCKQRLLAAFKAGKNITSEGESLMSQQLNGTNSSTTPTHEDGAGREHKRKQQQQQQPEQSSREELCNSHGGSFEERHGPDSSSPSSLANCDVLDNVQQNIISTSLMNQTNSSNSHNNENNKNKAVRNCSSSEVGQIEHFQCTEMLEDCCGCCCDEEQQQPLQQIQQDIRVEKKVDTCKFTSSLYDSVVCNLMSIDDSQQKENSSKKILAKSMVSLDIGGVVRERVAPPGKDMFPEDPTSSPGKTHERQQLQRCHGANLLTFIQESQLALYWHRIKSRIYRRRQSSNLNSTEPDTSTDREIGHAVLVDELGHGSLVNVCKSCNCTTIQKGKSNKNNIKSNNRDSYHLDDNKSTTIINLGDVTATSRELRDNDNEDDDNDDDDVVVGSRLHTPTTAGLNIAESTANIAVSTVSPPTTSSTTTKPPTTPSILPTPNSVQHHSSQVIATSSTTTKTTLTTPTTNEGIESKRERKAAKTLAIITGVFVMCWLPFFIMAITMPLLNLRPHKYVFALMLWLGYINSMLNPIIYTIFSPDFRKAFKRLLCAMDDSNEMRRRKRMMRGGGGGNYGYTSTSQLQTTCGRSTTIVGGSNYNGLNSLSSNNSQQTNINNNNSNKSCNIILDKSEANNRKIFNFFDSRKCLPQVCQRHLDNLCNLKICKCCSCLFTLISSSSSSNLNQEEQFNNINTREQSLRRTAMKNNADRQQIGDENYLVRQGQLLNSKNNSQDHGDTSELNDRNNQVISKNRNNERCFDNQMIEGPGDKCSPMRRLYLRDQREQNQQQGTITSNRPAITRNDF